MTKVRKQAQLAMRKYLVTTVATPCSYYGARMNSVIISDYSVMLAKTGERLAIRGLAQRVRSSATPCAQGFSHRVMSKVASFSRWRRAR